MRRLFTSLSVLSLLLCILAAALWVRGNWNWDQLYLRTWNRTVWSFHCSEGRVTIRHYRNWPRPPLVRYVSGPIVDPLKADSSKLTGPIYAMNKFGGAHTRQWNWGQFDGSYGAVCITVLPDGSAEWDAPMARFHSLATNAWSKPMPFWQVALPHWVILVLLGVLPSSRLAAIAGPWLLLKFRRKEGCCATCGYDLRATPDRCPECGTVPANVKAKA
ncbi:MAG: hypothetical protein JWL69_3670 [Phycisphaerales bacterium]|nr:hypothetical protein [Phycisphaerales bacterium]